MTVHNYTKTARTLLASAILSTGIASTMAGPAPEKNVVLPVADSNPLSFLDGKLTFDIQERIRFEVRNNNFDFDDSINAITDDSWVLQRVRLGMTIKPNSWFKFYIQAQDSREFESERPNIPGAAGTEGDDNFDLRQAYFEFGDGKTFPLTAKIGRQTLSYGDERLIGAFDWNNFGRTFDAAKFVWRAADWQLDLFTSSVVVIKRDEFNKSDLFNGNENDRELTFSGAYFTADKLPFGSADIYALLLTESNGSTTNLQGALPIPQPTGAALGAQHSAFGTYGVRIKGDPKKLNGFEFAVEAAYQNGVVRDQALNAFAVAAGAGYNFDMAWKPRLWAEYNYASGDDNPLDNSSETFQNLFPTNHKFYGMMDLFSWQNTNNTLISLKANPHKKVAVQLDYSAYWLASTDDVWYRANGATAVRPLTPLAQSASNFAGQEIDLSVTWNFNKNIQFQAGYAHFFAGDYLADTGPSADADFGYVQASFTF